MKHPAAVSILLSAIGMIVAGPISFSVAHESPPDHDAIREVGGELAIETLLSAELEGVEGTDVIVSRVTMPPNTTLPKHWHPGEEFGFVLEGSVVLWQEGEPDIPAKAGEVVKIPLKRVHTAITGAEGASILVFRVHERGQPERVLVD